MLGSARREAAAAVLAERAGERSEVHRALRAADRPGALAEIEREVDALWAAYIRRLGATTAARRAPTRALARLDAAMRTEEPELMDRPELAEERRWRMVQKLDLFNRSLGTYGRALTFVGPLLGEARARNGRSVPRLLDLASGYGGFPMELVRHARRRGIEVEVEGSDVQAGHVASARRRARERGLPVRFRELNAFHMEQAREGEIDVVTMLQAMHHFTPGQLARMIAESLRVGTTGFVGIDAVRSPALVPHVPVHTFLVTWSRDLAHDALLSVRKMYDREELAMIARAAVPDARIRCRSRLPAFNVLEVERPS